MKIGAFWPQDPILHLFAKHSKHEFYDKTVQGMDMLFSASVTQWRRVIGHKVDTGLPLVCHVWDIPVNWRSWCRNENDYLRTKHRDIEIVRQLDFLNMCDLVISCSEHTQNVLNMLGIKSEVLHNFYDGEGIDLSLENVKIEKKNRIMQVSRYALNKRFHLTLEMWDGIKDKYPDWELMFVGPDGDVSDEIKSTSMERVTIQGELDRKLLVTLMAESKILVQPSLNEGFGLTPLEARHLGLDTVCSYMPWTREFEYATRVFEPENVESYKQAVEGAIEVPTGLSIKPSSLTPKAYAERFDKLIAKGIK